MPQVKKCCTRKPGPLPDTETQIALKFMRTLLSVVGAALCLITGAYPLVYLLAENDVGLLQIRNDAVASNFWWRLGFHAHILTGGAALATGWSQFIRPWRLRFPKLHRAVGTFYALMVLVSGLAAVCISPMAFTGRIAALGFGTLGLLWLYFTLQACSSIRQRNLQRHGCMMVYSYSACCAAVTLRLWLPLLYGVFKLDFALAYPIVAWLCWVPNLLIAGMINHRALQTLSTGPDDIHRP